MPTSIRLESKTVTIEDYERKIDSNIIINALNTAKSISGELNNNPGTLQLISIFSIADINDFDVYIDNYDDTTLIFSLTSRKGNMFVFNFAVKWRENEI